MRIPARGRKERRRAQRSGRLWPRVARLSRRDSQRYANGVDDLPEHGFRRFRFSLQRSVARAGYDAMRKNGDGKVLEIVRNAVIAPIEKSARLRGALQHERSARANSQRELVVLARSIHDLER